jgi:TRAP-type C4-dicarboxylate transport system permease small subunit
MIFTEICTRYFLQFSIYWVNSVAEFLLVWFFLIGAGLALRHNAHVGFEFCLDLLPKRLAHGVYILSRLIIILFCAVMAWSGYLTLEPASRQIEGATQISFLWVMLSFPIGFVLLVYHQIALLAGTGMTRPPPGNLAS